jgi:3-methylcrotonyl-CoA carboxylase alpha subunit
VAVFSEPDRYSKHAQMADEAYYIGPAESSASYLRAEKIIEVAKASGAQGIHPGYGFLSENAGFARLCASSGVEFIGPPASAIEAMGSKSASKDIMIAAGVPCVPGYHGDQQDTEFLQSKAEEVGYPIMIKAVLGGGGKGMRIVHSPEQFVSSLEACRREAQASFSDSRVLIERFVARPRHVEVQVFCDKLGNAVYLFERDCSVQRRHQKVLEEAPAPGLSPELRESLGTAAVNAARAVGYVGAGTVEFIMGAEDKEFFFMEMNTRLQVEHPITELISGVDLVEWQIRAASGQSIPLKQEELKINGHAVEARVYAEDPYANFMPGTGKLVHLQFPAAINGIRVDTGVREGDEVSIYYDPMIAKMIAHGPDREVALKKLARALRETRLVGPPCNLDFLVACLESPEFVKGGVDTSFIEKNEAALLHRPVAPPVHALAAATFARLWIRRHHHRDASASTGADPWSPFHALSQFWPNLSRTHAVTFTYGDGAPISLQAEVQDENELRLTLSSGDVLDVSGLDVSNLDSPAWEHVRFCVNGEAFQAAVLPSEKSGDIHVFTGDGHFVFGEETPEFLGTNAVAAGSMVAPMPGKVTHVLVKKGDAVKMGQPLMIMEAMKMEHTIAASCDGVVEDIMFVAGDVVPDSAPLIQVTTP